MPRNDESTDCICFKVVFCGPGEGGKTTALRSLHEVLDPDVRDELICLSTKTERTLFFDFLAVDLGYLDAVGQSVRLHLYTAPGQIFYEEARRQVLQGADGLVFVADSTLDRQSANAQSMVSLELACAAAGCALADLPLVFAFNKRDLPDRVPVEKMSQILNHRGCPEVETVASTGSGLRELLEAVCGLLLQRHRGAREIACSPQVHA